MEEAPEEAIVIENVVDAALQRQLRHRRKSSGRRGGSSRAKENRAPVAEVGAVLVAGAAAVGFSLLKRLHSRSCELARQLSETRSELQSTSSQLSEVLSELNTTREQLASTSHELEAKVAALEAQQKELEQQQAALEAARGELGTSNSRLQLIEKELRDNQRYMRSQAEQLERARYELAATRYGPFGLE